MLTAEVYGFGAARGPMSSSEALALLRQYLPVFKSTQMNVNVDDFDVLLDRSEGWSWGMSPLHRVVRISRELFNALNGAMNRAGKVLATFDIPSAAPRLKTIGPDVFNAHSTLGTVRQVRFLMESAILVLEAEGAHQQYQQQQQQQKLLPRLTTPVKVAIGLGAAGFIALVVLAVTGRRAAA